MGLVTIGVDLGQKRDPTAICVAEDDPREAEPRSERHFIIRHLERLPLGTSYPRVADRLAEVTDGARARAGSSPTIYVDATGVGEPVVDLLREQARSATVVAVYFTHGDRRTETTEGAHTCIILGKARLVSRLQTLLQANRLHLAPTHEAAVLTQELLNYEICADENANDRYGAFRVGTHDDLVTALGLAVQVDPVDLVAQFGWAGRPRGRPRGTSSRGRVRR